MLKNKKSNLTPVQDQIEGDQIGVFFRLKIAKSVNAPKMTDQDQDTDNYNHLKM